MAGISAAWLARDGIELGDVGYGQVWELFIGVNLTLRDGTHGSVKPLYGNQEGLYCQLSRRRCACRRLCHHLGLERKVGSLGQMSQQSWSINVVKDYNSCAVQ